MCIALPMRVLRGDGLQATCQSRYGEEAVNMLLVGAQAVDTWVLVFLGWAREVLSAEDAAAIDLALNGLQAIADGATSINVEQHFPGLSPSSVTAPPLAEPAQRYP